MTKDLMYHDHTHIKCVFRLITIVMIMSLTGIVGYGQSTGDYRTRQAGNWNGSNTWERYNGSSWVNVATYPGQIPGDDSAELLNNHSVTITASVPYAIGSLTINGGSEDTYLTFNSGVALTVTGETYLNSNSNGDEKSIWVDAGNFATGSLDVNSSGTNNSRDAYVRISSGTVTVSGDISLNSTAGKSYILFTGNGSLNVGGTITGGNITSTTGGGTSAPTSGTVNYNGTPSQTIASYTYYGLGISNNAQASLEDNTTVNGQLIMTSGTISTGSYTLTLNNSSPSSLIYTSGTVHGTFTRAIAQSSNGSDYLFPVGTPGKSRPAMINFSSLNSNTNITARYIESNPGTFTPYSDNGQTVNNLFTEGYWRFSSNNSPTVSNYTLTLTPAGFESFPFDSYSRISGRNSTNTTWRAIGSHGSVTAETISRTGITERLNTTSFDYAIATCYTPVFLGYRYERNITIDHNQVAGDEDLFNFPVMISLDGQSFLRTNPNGDIYSSGGYDIIFTDEAYNRLDHQIESYNGTNGDLVAWVRIPTLSTSSNTVIKIIYGNPLVTADQSVTTVWDSHYKGVWHLNGTPLSDNTSYNYAGTPYGSPGYTTGTINSAMNLNGSSQYMQVNNASHLNFTGNITVSAWIYMDNINRDQKIAGNQVGDSGGGYKFGVYTNNKLEFEIRTTSGTAVLNRDVSGGTTLAPNRWYYVSGVSSDVLDSIMTYVDGVRERPYRKTGTLGTGSNTLVVGKEPFQSSYYFDGRFDELRISDRVRSTGWIRTEYNNQISPSTFFSIDATGVVAENLPSQSLCGGGPITLAFGYPAGGTYSGNPYISGNVFNPPVPGTYTISYTYIGGCGATVVTRDFIITGKPSPPAASDVSFCQTQIASMTATGQNIKWYSGGTLVSTANPYSPGLSTPGTYNFTVTQTVNGCESDPTAVTLGIYSGVTITTQPQSTSVCQGSNAVISVAAAGYNMSYQWQRNGSNIANGSQYSGVNTPSLTILTPSTALSGSVYRCVITTTCGTGATSGTAALTVTAPPVATFSYTGSPYCPNAPNPNPTFSGGGTAGTFSSTAGLVFVSTSTGRINIAASTPGVYTVTNTVNGTGACSPAIATASLEIISTASWTGASNTNWNNTANWSCGYIPTGAMSVNIPNVANKPVLSGGSVATVKDLVIAPGATLTISANTLTISGSVSGSNSLDASAGTIIFAGPLAQTIPSGLFTGNTILNLTTSNTNGVSLAGPLNVSGVVRVTSGSLASGGYLTLLSTASGTALIDGSGAGTVTGDVTMQRYLTSGFGYKYLSSPFQDATVDEFGDDMNLAFGFPLLYRYDENNAYSGWVGYTTGTAPLNSLEGYAVNLGDVSAAKTVDITGTVNNGNISRTLYNNDRTYTKGFNLVGNPYPSPINWNAAGWTKTNIDNAIYYFRASPTDQYGGTYSSYVNGISSDGQATNIIPSMQGFLVHVSAGTFPVTGTLGVSNSVRITDRTHPFLKSSRTESISPIRITAGFTDDTTSYDPLAVYFDNSADTTFDSLLDALKIYNTNMMVTNFYSVLADGQKLSVNALPEPKDSLLTIPLGLSIYRDGEVRFRLIDIGSLPEGGRIYFRDAETGAVTPIFPSGEYKISLTAGEYDSRFSVSLHKSLTDIKDPAAAEELFTAYISHGKIRTEVSAIVGNSGLITVHTLAGNMVYAVTISDTGIYDLDVETTPGVYLIRYSTGKRSGTKKLIAGTR